MAKNYELKGSVKMKLKRFNNITLCILIVLAVANLCGCSKANDSSFSKNVTEAMEKLDNYGADTDYNNYVTVTMKKPEIKPIEDNKNSLDSDKCYVFERLIFKNITNKNIRFDCRIFLSKEFITSIAYAPTNFGPVKEITLEPNKSLGASAAVLMKKAEAFTKEEKSIYDKCSGRVCVELIIDGNHYNFIQEPNSK